MKGGYQILILSDLTLAVGTETSITDSYILNQLLGLTDFLNKDGLVDKQLKPILIITKDSAGFVSLTNPEANKLLIDGYINGKHIQLNIVYTASVDEYGNTVYAISSAKYLYNAVLEFENIVDKDGNPRFIEGEIEPNNLPSGMSKSYGKWSLSGSHFMLVFAGKVEANTTFNSFSIEISNIPKWIRDKIVPLFASNIASQNVQYFSDTLELQTGMVYLQKLSNDNLYIYIGGITITSAKSFRVAFDLLIDNE